MRGWLVGLVLVAVVAAACTPSPAATTSAQAAEAARKVFVAQYTQGQTLTSVDVQPPVLGTDERGQDVWKVSITATVTERQGASYDAAAVIYVDPATGVVRIAGSG
jgi:ABC-type dipeptide/oligopeptide/nickel transport system permease subunit